MVLAVLILPGLVGGVSLMLQYLQRTSTSGNCSTYAVSYDSSSAPGSCHGATNHTHQVQAIGHPKGDVLEPILISLPRQIAPIPTIIPHLVPTPSSPTSPGQASVIAMIEQVFGPYAPGAVQVAKCESGLNPGAYNPVSNGGSHAEGLFQILYPSTWRGTAEASSSPYSAMANILAAHQIFVRDGNSWRAWTCAP
jgi:hypothetical protein